MHLLYFSEIKLRFRKCNIWELFFVCYSLLQFSKTEKTHGFSGLRFFTVISDWFLVIKQSDYLLALITFTIAQFFYAIRLWENDGSVNRNKNTF